MVPKIIHYVWLSEDTKPLNIEECIDSWKKVMPDYQIKLWNTTNFDITLNSFVKEACELKKWAFATDYIRLYALYTDGGIYLDSDVLVKKRFDEFLQYDFFSSVEYHIDIIKSNNIEKHLFSDGTPKIAGTAFPGIGIQAAIMGSIAGHAFVKDCMDYYDSKHFILGNGKYFDKLIAPSIYAITAEKYGFKYKEGRQDLNSNMVILPSEVFAGTVDQATDLSYAIHYCEGSWRPKRKFQYLYNMFYSLKKILNSFK